MSGWEFTPRLWQPAAAIAADDNGWQTDEFWGKHYPFIYFLPASMQFGIQPEGKYKAMATTVCHPTKCSKFAMSGFWHDDDEWSGFAAALVSVVTFIRDGRLGRRSSLSARRNGENHKLRKVLFRTSGVVVNVHPPSQRWAIQ